MTTELKMFTASCAAASIRSQKQLDEFVSAWNENYPCAASDTCTSLNRICSTGFDALAKEFAGKEICLRCLYDPKKGYSFDVNSRNVTENIIGIEVVPVRHLFDDRPLSVGFRPATESKAATYVFRRENNCSSIELTDTEYWAIVSDGNLRTAREDVLAYYASVDADTCGYAGELTDEQLDVAASTLLGYRAEDETQNDTKNIAEAIALALRNK